MTINTDLETVIEELTIGNQILVSEGIIDGFGHISVRNPRAPEHYFMLLDNSGTGGFLELDSTSSPVVSSGPAPSIERFIHGEIYRSRPDVNAIVHTHSPPLIPFGVTNIQLKPLFHMCGFLSDGAPVFDIEKAHGMTDMLVTNQERGQSLAKSLGKSAVVLMRGHGATVVGTSIKEAVFRAVYTTINAKIQPVAMQMGTPKFLAPEEAKLADEVHHAVLSRPWGFWKKKLGL